MRHSRILVIEDDESIQEFYKDFFEVLHRQEFDWTLVSSGEKALAALKEHQSEPFDVVVLDWGLPGMTGFDVLRKIKADLRTIRLPVFMITGHGKVEDCVTAFEAGADDYVVKPIVPEELWARLRSILRRAGVQPEEGRSYVIDDLELDTQRAAAVVSGQEVRLYPKEMELLAIFMRRPNVLHSPAFLWDTVWGYESPNREKVLGVTISTLRKKLGPRWAARLETHRGRGYMFSVEL